MIKGGYECGKYVKRNIYFGFLIIGGGGLFSLECLCWYVCVVLWNRFCIYMGVSGQGYIFQVVCFYILKMVVMFQLI